MAKNRDYCFRHSKMYEGWQCPLCLEEQERGSAKPAAPAAPPAGRPGDRDGAPQPAAGRQPSRAESNAKNDQAEAMLLSGAAREALDMCESAIDADPSNLGAHLVGARACRVLRDSAREQELLEGAVRLLHTEDYGKTSRWYIDVLKHVREGRIVGQLAQAFAAAREWPADEALAMVKALVGRGATWEALVVLDSLPASNRSLLTCAYSVQLSPSAGAGVDPNLLRYLQSVPASERARVLAGLYEVEAADVLAGATAARVRDAVRTRYAEWTTEIKQLLSEEARRTAAEQVAPQLNGPAVSSAIRFFLGAFVLAVVVVGVAGGGGAGILVGTVVALGCAGAGFAYGRDVELKRLLPSVLPGIREALTNREVERWASVLSDEPLQSSTGGAAEAPGPTEACPYCMAPVPAEAPTCPSCARPLTPPGTGPAAEGETPPEDGPPR